MKKIFISGATGFIGKHLCEKLLKEKYHITAFIRSKSQDSKTLQEKGVELLLDDESLSNTKKLFKNNKFDGVIHLATCYIAQHSFDDINNLIKSNITFSTKLLEIANNANIPWFLNTGTFWQHLNNKEYSPANLYAATKQAFENIAQYYTETSNIKFVTLKLNDSYGPNDTRPKVFNLWDKISKTGESFDMSEGEQLIDIVHIYDITKAFSEMISLLLKAPRKLTEKYYSVSSGELIKLKDLAKVYESITNKNLNINWGAKPYRKREIMTPCNNIPLVPNWKPKISIEHGIKMNFN